MSKKLLRLFRRKPKVIDFWDCSHLHLNELPREVLEHRHTLRALYIQTNSIRDFPRTLYLFDGLTELDMSENDLLFLPPSISKLQSLQILNLGKNSINNMPDTIGQLQELEVFDMSSNPISAMCDGLVDCKQLRVLIFNDCQVEELPPNIGKLSKLEVLELRENILQNLPASMSHLTLLNKLDLGNNEFVTMPTVIGSLESLAELWFDTNTISVVPEELGNLRNLRFLELSENHLMLLPDTIGQLANLTDLYLNDNLLTFLPESLGDLHNLQILRLDNNRLGHLPETLDGLVNCLELNVAHNHIPELPPSIGGMTELNNLVLDDNILRDLPPELGNCTSLTLLSFRNNQIMDIPAEFSNLTKLSILNLVGNQLQYLPYTFTTLKSVTAIWIAENQSRPILDLQLIRGDDGEKYLTCFLFPQQGRERPYEETTSPLDAVADEDYEDRMLHRKASQVNFDPKVTDRKSNLTRDPTPFPKELHSKAMQWRAAREKGVGGPHHGREGAGSPGVGMDEVALRRPLNRRLPNRYSLLKALSDPLIEENLLPPIEGGRHHSQSSYYETISPPPTIPEEQRSSSATPNSSSAGKATPTSPNTIAVVSSGPTPGQLTAQTGSTPGRTGMTSSELGSPPPVSLPPFYSPEGSSIQPVQSGPYLDPPDEFSMQNTGSPTSRQVVSPISAATKPHPPVNGDIRRQQVEIGGVSPTSVSTDQHARREEERETSPFDIDRPLVLANTNGNNSSDPNCRVVPVLTEGYSVMVKTADGHHQPSMSSPSSRGLHKTDTNFPSRSSIMTHSDNAEVRSSMESGFDADNELENTTAWYLSPDSSPKQDTKNPRPKLGPQVEIVIGSPVRQQNKGPPSSSIHSSPNSMGAHHQMAHYQQYSGTASDMHSLGGSQSQQSRESSISEYDRLQHDRVRQQQKLAPGPAPGPAPLHEDQPYYDNVMGQQQRRSSVPGEVGYEYYYSDSTTNAEEAVYSEAYPVPVSSVRPAHKASRSFDSADILNERLQQAGSGGRGGATVGPKTAPRFMSHPLPPHPPQHVAMTTIKKAAGNRVVLFNGHNPTPGAPLSPVTALNGGATVPPPPSSYQQSRASSRALAGRDGSTTTTTTKATTKPYDHLIDKIHSRSRSQPEETVNIVHVGTSPHPSVVAAQPTYANTTQLPARSQHSYHNHHHHHHHHHHRKDGTSSYSSGSSSGSGHRRYHHEQPVFKSSYPGHYKRGTKSHHHRNGAGKSIHHRHGGRNGSNNMGHHSPSQLQTFSARAVVDSRMAATSNRTPQYEAEGGSQESFSGQGTTPETTPTPAARKAWTTNGNDSGFDSMQRDGRQGEIVGGDSTHQHFHSGVCIEVSLTKDPTLGLGITGGSDGENTVKPGDTGFHVYRVIDGLPAKKCGKIAVGDKLLQVDGVEVTSLTTEEVLSLLTGPEETVSLLLYREPSETLL